MTDRNDEYRPDNPTANTTRRGGQGPAREQGTQRPHGAEEYAARDYARGQVQGQEGLEREYGTRFDRGYEETSQGEAASRSHAYGRGYEDRFGAGGQSDWGHERAGQFQYGLPRQDRADVGGGGYQRGSQDYGGYAGRQAGEGYGRSSGYGNPEQDRYADTGYRGTSFVSPADTQLSHSGLGRQSYSGLGPKNYTRSDERITEDLCERLTQDHDIDASELEVNVAHGMATLEGTVPQRWMKHRAEDLADGCAGVRNVENRIKVQPASASYTGPSTQRDVGAGTVGAGTGTIAGQAGNPTGTAH